MKDDNKKNRRILVIDDNEAIHKDFRTILEDSSAKTLDVSEEEAAIFGAQVEPSEQEIFEIDSAFQGKEGLEKIRQAANDGRPYIMAFVDIRMPPGWDGIETIKRIWLEYPNLQVSICTAYSDYSWKTLIQELGYTDKLLIIKKPFDNIEVIQMACSLAQKWDLLNNVEEYIIEQKREILDTQDLTFFALSKLAESHYPEISTHLEHIRALSKILAEQLAKEGYYKNQITEQFIDDLIRSSPLHDIGKVGVPDAILLKPGELNQGEFEVMKRHTIMGEKIIKSIVKHKGSSNFLTMAMEVARSHHERFDGCGYPDGLGGLSSRDIPLSARIVALADVFEALTSVRVYKSAIDPNWAKTIIEDERGNHFDPIIVDAFCARWDDFVEVCGLTADDHKLELVESDLSMDVRR